MATRLTSFARQLLLNEAMARAELVQPVLVWEAPQTGLSDDSVLTKIVSELEDALVGGQREDTPKPSPSEPLVFRVQKNLTRPTVTGEPVVLVGRTEENDVALPDPSVSRVHASFREDVHTHQWKLMDMGSTNGTFIGRNRLPAHQLTLVTDRARLRFGNVDMVFYQPSSFFEYLRSMMDASSPASAGTSTAGVLVSSDEIDALVDFYLQAVRTARDLESSDVAKKAHAVLRRLNLAAENRRGG